MTLDYDTHPVMMAAADYADLIQVSERTVKRWLADGELPGAMKDERGRWLIPSTAERTASPAEVVTLDRPMTSPMTGVEVTHPAQMSLDILPSFLTIDQAAQILGISRHAIATHREYFDVVPFGSNGSLVVPLATIKKIRG